MLPPDFIESASTLQREPLYKQVAELIRAQYVAGRSPGTQLPAESDLKREFRLSMTTVRSALNELQLQGWVERRHGSGTYVLERTEDDRHVALLLELDVSDSHLSPFYLRQLQMLRVELMKAGIQSRPYIGHLKIGIEIGELTCREFLYEVRKGRVSGVISVLACPHFSWTGELRRRSIPLIGSLASMDCQVNVDEEGMHRVIFEHFRKCGYRRIACMERNSSLWLEPYAQLENKVRMMRLALEYGLTLEGDSLKVQKGLSTQEACQSICELWHQHREKPDAFLIQSDVVFEACVRTIQGERGGKRVGFGVVGSDAVPLTLPPRAIYCLFPVEALVRERVAAMRSLLRGESVPSKVDIPFSVIHGEDIPHRPPTRRRNPSLLHSPA